MSNYEIIEAGGGKHVKAWNGGVYFEPQAVEQLKKCARLDIVSPYVAAMPDTHLGYGSTVGSVIPTKDAVIPAAVGVDIGCGMVYKRLDIHREDLPENLGELRAELEAAIPNGGPGDVGSWEIVPQRVRTVWMQAYDVLYDAIGKKHPSVTSKFAMRQLGTLGTGNHFLELTLDSEEQRVGVLLHSGSRGMGNRIGSYFTQVAKEKCKGLALPDRDLAFLRAGTEEFNDYISALTLAQLYAWDNRLIMLASAMGVVRKFVSKTQLQSAYDLQPDVHCHHNYMNPEYHFGENLFVTRKGAVRARKGDLGIIPGSMGAKTYIVRGLGSEDSFQSCSHGAGRVMSRSEAKRRFTVADHIKATEGVECCKTAAVIDETPGAYKSIDYVIAAQKDLIEPVYHMKQFLCVKGYDKPKRGKRGRADLLERARKRDEREEEKDGTTN